MANSQIKITGLKEFNKACKDLTKREQRTAYRNVIKDSGGKDILKALRGAFMSGGSSNYKPSTRRLLGKLYGFKDIKDRGNVIGIKITPRWKKSGGTTTTGKNLRYMAHWFELGTRKGMKAIFGFNNTVEAKRHRGVRLTEKAISKHLEKTYSKRLKK